MQPFLFHIPETLLARLRAVSMHVGLPVSALIRLAISQYLDAVSSKHVLPLPRKEDSHAD